MKFVLIFLEFSFSTLYNFILKIASKLGKMGYLSFDYGYYVNDCLFICKLKMRRSSKSISLNVKTDVRVS